MKIDKECINYNMVRLIDAEVDCPNEYSDDKYDHDRLITLGYIQGVLQLGEELKKVLDE